MQKTDIANSSATESLNVHHNWYALKVFYNRTAEIERYAAKFEMESYIAMRTVEYQRQGVTIRRRIPLISSLMFIRCSKEQISKLKQEFAGKVMIYGDRKGQEPKQIDEREMQIFKLVTGADSNFDYIDIQETIWSRGDRVRVIGGQFEGAEGYIHRIKGDRRLIVSIEGVVAVATSYIPGSLLKRVP